MKNPKLVVRCVVAAVAGALSLYSAPCRAQDMLPAPAAIPWPVAAPPPIVRAPVPQLADLDRPIVRLDAGGQVPSGFVLRASFGGRVGLNEVILGTGNVLELGLFAGGKSGRIIAGLGLEFSNLSGLNQSSSGSSPQSISSLLIAPEVMIAIARSADERVEFVLDAALGLGGIIASTSGTGLSGSSNSSNSFQLSYHLGPGVRFWAHRHFAIQGLAGFGGQAIFAPSGSTASPFSVHGIFASVGLLGAI